MSDTSDAWRVWVKWYEIPKTPWTTGSNLNWIVLASPPDRRKFMIISQGQTHTWLWETDIDRICQEALTQCRRDMKGQEVLRKQKGWWTWNSFMMPNYVNWRDRKYFNSQEQCHRQVWQKEAIWKTSQQLCTAFHHPLQTRFLPPLVVFFLPLQKQLVWIRPFPKKFRGKLQLCLDFKAPQRICFLDWMKGQIKYPERTVSIHHLDAHYPPNSTSGSFVEED